MELQIVDLFGDTFRDLTSCRNFNLKPSNKQPVGGGGKRYEVEVQEESNGDTQLGHVSSFKIYKTSEAALMIDKCLEYQKKLEADIGVPCSLVHTVLIIKLQFGTNVKSQLYFTDLGISERKLGNTIKEYFVISSGMQALFKLITQL